MFTEDIHSGVKINYGSAPDQGLPLVRSCVIQEISAAAGNKSVALVQTIASTKGGSLARR